MGYEDSRIMYITHELHYRYLRLLHLLHRNRLVLRPNTNPHDMAQLDTMADQNLSFRTTNVWYIVSDSKIQETLKSLTCYFSASVATIVRIKFLSEVLDFNDILCKFHCE